MGRRGKNDWFNRIYRVLWKIFHHEEIVFYAQEPVRYVVFKPIHKYLPEVKIVTNDITTARYLRKNKIPYRWRLGFPTVVISGHYLRRTYNIPEIKKIHTFHGMAKDVGFKETNQQFDLLLLMGEYAKERFDAMGMSQYQLVGYPKLDVLFDGTLNNEQIKQRLGIDPHLPTVLYAPTWGSTGSVPMIKDQLIVMGQSGKYNILVKLHDKSRSWRKYFTNIKNVHLIDDPDIVPYYSVSDLMISDYSSVIFEFAVLNRPIVLVDTNTSHYPSSSIGIAWRDIGYRVSDPNKLMETMEHAFAHSEEKQGKRKEYTQQLFYKMDGKAGKRAAEAIRQFVQNIEKQ